MAVNTWYPKTNMPVGQNGLAAFAVDGKGYAVGGIQGDYKDCQEYDPDTNAWTAKTDMPVGQNYLAAFAIDGKGYAVGGNVGTKKNCQEYVAVVTTVSGTLKDTTGTLVGAGETVYAVAKWGYPQFFTDDTDASGEFSIDIDGAADDTDEDKIAVFCWPSASDENGDIQVNV